MMAEGDTTVESGALPTVEVQAADGNRAAVAEWPLETTGIPTLVEDVRVRVAMHRVAAVNPAAVAADRRAAVDIPAVAITGNRYDAA
jgi:hypothetical protein